ncbi:hypothetical protein MP228_003836 [Amoeboaphelidium protococcarum]|nr:hypothetical protein MP228_003836 [Amoeboaphelidium protococcarum]
MQQQDDRDLVKLWKVHKTIHKMAKDRGYSVGDNEFNLSLDEFRNQFGSVINRDALAFMFTNANEPSDQLIVFFTEETSVGVKPIRTFVQTMSEKGIMRAIVVIRNHITPAAAKVMMNLPKLKFEMFHEAELLVNITEHQLVPKHVLLTAGEKAELLKRYRLKESQLPRMLQSDPVARYFGLRRGDVVKIIRPSETAGRYVTYRLVM